MNETTSLLQDIELAPAVSNQLLLTVTIVLAGLLIFAGIIWFWYKRQKPLAKAIRNLDQLNSTDVNLSAIATILHQALQVERLADSSLPDDFIQQLEQARFSATPCSRENCNKLKEKAKSLLWQIQKENELNE